MKSLPRQCFSMFPPTCLHDSADCSNRFPDHPPLKVIYSHVAINDKLEVKRNSEKVRSIVIMCIISQSITLLSYNYEDYVIPRRNCLCFDVGISRKRPY